MVVSPSALILGGTGFLGSALGSELKLSGWDVDLLGRRTGRDPMSLDLKSYDVVVNALANYGRNGETRTEIEWVNSLLPMKMAERLFADGTRPHLFFNVDTALEASVSPYAQSKASLRQGLKKLAARSETAIFGIRFDQFYGPGENQARLVTMLLFNLMKNEQEIGLTSGRQVRRFLYHMDAAKLIVECLERWRNGTLPCSAASVALVPLLGVECSVRDLALKAQTLCQSGGYGMKTRLNFGAIADRTNELAVRDLPSEFQFLEARSFVSLDAGLKAVYESLRERFRSEV